MVVLWPPTDDPLENSVRRAVQCGLDIQAHLHAAELGEGVTLSVKVGIGVGDVSIVHLGGETDHVGGKGDGLVQRMEYIATGSPLVQAFTAEHCAVAGNVICSREVWEMISDSFEGIPAPLDEHHHETRLIQKQKRGKKVTYKSVRGAGGGAVDDLLAADGLEGKMWSFIPRAVAPFLKGHDEEWGNELRRVSVMFVNLGFGDADLARLLDGATLHAFQAVFTAVQRAVYRYEGTINKFLVDDKGSTLVAVFGLPPLAHEQDSTRAVLAGLAVSARLRELGNTARVGVTTGMAFCGVVGNRTRREYSVLGDVVNLSARLMQLAGKTDKFICTDRRTYEAAKRHVFFQQLPSTTVKGKSMRIEVFTPVPDAAHVADELEKMRPGATATFGRNYVADVLQLQLEHISFNNELRRVRRGLQKRITERSSVDSKLAGAIFRRRSVATARARGGSGGSVTDTGMDGLEDAGDDAIVEEDDDDGSSVFTAARVQLPNGMGQLTVACVECNTVGDLQRAALELAIRRKVLPSGGGDYVLMFAETETPLRDLELPLNDLNSVVAVPAGMRVLQLKLVRSSVVADGLLQAPMHGTRLAAAMTRHSSVETERSPAMSRGAAIGRRRSHLDVSMSLIEEAVQRLLRFRSKTVVVVTGKCGSGKTHMLSRTLFNTSTARVAVGCGDRFVSSTSRLPFTAWCDMLRQLLQSMCSAAEPEEVKVLNSVLQSLPAALRARSEELATLLGLPADELVVAVGGGEAVVVEEEDEEEDADAGKVEEEKKEDSEGGDDAGDGASKHDAAWLADMQAMLMHCLRWFTTRGPVILVIDDGHCLDSASWSLLEEAASQLTNVLLVLSTRPFDDYGLTVPKEYLSVQELDECCKMDMVALEAHETMQLACSVLQVDSIPDELDSVVQAKSQGNPYFTKELLRELLGYDAFQLSDGRCTVNKKFNLAGVLPVPASISAVLGLVVDRLTVAQQMVLKVGSVIGTEFHLGLLHDAYPIKAHLDRLEEDVQALLDLHIIRPLNDDLVADSRELMTKKVCFSSGYMREVVYNRMLFAHRNLLKKRVKEVSEAREAALRRRFGKVAVSGWLEVKTKAKGLGVKYWKRRYGVLGDGSVTLYKKEGDTTARSVLYLEGARVDVVPLEDVQKEHVFRLSVRSYKKERKRMTGVDRDYLLGAGSDRMLKDWLYGIRFEIERLAEEDEGSKREDAELEAAMDLALSSMPPTAASSTPGDISVSLAGVAGDASRRSISMDDLGARPQVGDSSGRLRAGRRGTTTSTTTLFCPVCSEAFRSAPALREHHLEKHPGMPGLEKHITKASMENLRRSSFTPMALPMTPTGIRRSFVPSTLVAEESSGGGAGSTAVTGRRSVSMLGLDSPRLSISAPSAPATTPTSTAPAAAASSSATAASTSSTRRLSSDRSASLVESSRTAMRLDGRRVSELLEAGGAAPTDRPQPMDWPGFKAVLNRLDAFWESMPIELVLINHHTSMFHDLGAWALTTSSPMDDKGPVAYLLGYRSQRTPEEAVIHAVAVLPRFRRLGIARGLYRHFMATARAAGCLRMRAVVNLTDVRSQQFHKALGFTFLHEGAEERGGELVHPDYGGPGVDMLVLVRSVEEEL
eukprot:PLAT12494.2.p1 GENE.PLAT12494.2~~PLAT12494.2.p1  ORF type:complete len:1725 (-),score=861.37 PLAT12494.2:94-4923(-)